jgi:hypothetical protein
MATRQKRGANHTVKKETSVDENSEFIDDQAQDDALE